MSELRLLHRHLRAALGLSPVLFLAPVACTSGGERASTERSDGAKDKSKDQSKDTTEVGEEDAPTTAIPPERSLPTCPSGDWCGSKALATKLVRQPQEGVTFAADIAGCPGELEGNEERQAELGETVTGMPVHGGMLATIDAEETKARHEAGQVGTCCYEWMEMCPGGRPLLDGGSPVLAQLRAGDDWCAELPELDMEAIANLDPATRAEIAEAWLADALMEHSSIASFERAREELREVGGPAELLEAYTLAAEDERRHARLCFGLAARYFGRALAPRELPGQATASRGGGLAEVAVDTFIEGCIGETVAAACARRAAGQATDPGIRQLLAEIADDETEHASLAWRALAWALAEGGSELALELLVVADQLRPGRPTAAGGEDERDRELLAAHGRLVGAQRDQVRAQVWREIIEPLLTELLDPRLARLIS